MAKITLSVPDELYEKMKEWKSSLNFSRVFQNAVSGMIQRKEELTYRIRKEMDFSAIVDRLKKEKMDLEFNFMEWGKNDGLEWCKTAHYQELQYALALASYEDAVHDEKLGGYFSDMFEKYKTQLATTGKKAQDAVNGFAEKYLRGWKEGVELFWHEVKNKL